MIIINFTHPLTDEQRAQIESMAGQPIAGVIDAPAKFANDESFAAQVVQMVDAIPLTPAQWQTEPTVIVPPAFSFGAVAMLAELHGRMGHFPPAIRLRPVEESLPPRFVVAEIINLQGIRDAARNGK